MLYLDFVMWISPVLNVTARRYAILVLWKMYLTCFSSPSQGQGAESKAGKHFAKIYLESILLQNRAKEVRITHTISYDNFIWHLSLRVLGYNVGLNIILLCLFSGQPWRNAFGGRSPLKNSCPANVSKYLFFFTHFLHLTASAITGKRRR